MRTSGAKNKPKHIKVKISDLNNIFKPDTEIEISAAYAVLFPSACVVTKENNEEENDNISPIEFSVS